MRTRTPDSWLDEIRLELLRVERAARLREVVDRLVGREPECEADVAELEVEVDDGDLVARLGEAHRQVARRQRLAGPALRAEHADHRRERRPRSPTARALLSGHRLLEHEADVRRILRQRQDVVGAGLEDPADEPVRRARRKHDHRPVRALLHRAVDQVERAVRVAGAGDDEEIGRSLLQRRPAVLEAVDDADDLDVGIDGQRRLNSLVVDALVEGDERSDRVAHPRLPPNDLTAVTGWDAEEEGLERDDVRSGRLAVRLRPEDDPDLAVVRREGEVSRLLVGDPQRHLGLLGPRETAGLLLRDVDDEGVLHEQLQDRPVRRLGVGCAVNVETLDVEPAEDVDLVADLHLADEAVRNIDRNADRALVGGEPVADRVRSARRELATR